MKLLPKRVPGGGRANRYALPIGILCLIAALLSSRGCRPERQGLPPGALPTPVSDRGFTTSDTCRSCHPGPYHTWHASFHRTMTQPAGPHAVLADFDDVTLENRGRVVHLSRRGDSFWAEIPDPLWFQDTRPDKPAVAPMIEVQIVMTTGSHHLQNYWFRRPSQGDVYRDSYDNGALVQLPWGWLIGDRVWVPTDDSFLQPPLETPEAPMLWNTACHLCHAVAAEPGFEEGAFATRAVELGIACEACHGPGEAHVRLNQSPLRRYARYLFGNDQSDPSIVNPARLDPQRSTEVCGRCHSFGRVVDMEKMKKSGVRFRPGDKLSASIAVLRYSEQPSDPHLLAQLDDEPRALVGRFWGDGTIRVAGREFNGLIESACYQDGAMTCLSCHSMHDYAERADQLKTDMQVDESCLGCHQRFRADPGRHTRHASGSEGSRCINCHMPHTTYGLLVAMRSHRIDSPDASISAQTGRPNACNLCHLDRTLAWTDRHLQQWYAQPAANLSDRQQEVAASVLWTLGGDAAQRAVVAWHMGWEPARRASGENWLGGHLAQLLCDPYAAVRHVAKSSLQTLPGFGEFEYNYVASMPELKSKRQQALALWQQALAGRPDRSGPHLLIDASGRIDVERASAIYHDRDDTALKIVE